MYQIFKKALEEGRIIILDKPERVLTPEDFELIIKGEMTERIHGLFSNIRPLEKVDREELGEIIK